jgi:LPS export ABC transporter protein LptC
MRWQKRARLGIAIFGIVFAAVVYSAIGERVTPTPAPAPERLDPNAIIESSGCDLRRITGTKRDFRITCDRQLAYENGASKLIGVRVEVKERAGRDFVITAGEGNAGEKQQDLVLSDDVKMMASDGFTLSTAAATFNQNEGIVRAGGPVSFSKGRMSGSGRGMTYDKNTDVLVLLDQAQVTMADANGGTTGAFTAGKATLSRPENYLLLETAVHVLRGEQTLDANRVRATLTEDDERITFIEMRENSRVAGGSGPFDSMNGDAIDIDYADDGQTVEKVVLSGGAMIALRGQQGRPGRHMRGGSLMLAFAPDGALTSAKGHENVQMDLPATDAAAARHIRASSLDATGEAGKGLTSARFVGDVEYREEGHQGAAPRLARSRELSVVLEGDAVSGAVFSGRAQFEEQGLKASAARARYEPAAGALQLTGADEGGGPRVADEQIAIEADAIEVTLEGRKMIAAGNVKTVLQAASKNTPGLLKKGQPANVSAAKLQYEGDPGRATYTGGAQLWQGDTAIRGDFIAIDQENGNLSATGNARSTLMFGAEQSIGRGDEIRYEDRTREITYAATGAPAPLPQGQPAPADGRSAAPPHEARPAPTSAASAPPAPVSKPAQLTGPQGNLAAQRIVVHLADTESRMERLEAADTITLRLDTRVATGSRLTYIAEDERYVLSGTAAVPVKVIEGCRETTGQTLTFFKTADRIIVDGNEERRTQTKTGGGPCPEPRSR